MSDISIPQDRHYYRLSILQNPGGFGATPFTTYHNNVSREDLAIVLEGYEKFPEQMGKVVKIDSIAVRVEVTTFTDPESFKNIAATKEATDDCDH